MSAVGPPALEAQRLCYTIGGVPIVRGVDLEIAPGQILGLIGPNGAGKTTVLDLLSGLSFPDEGVVRIKGMDVTRLPTYRRARHGLARTFQESPAVPRLSTYEHLQLACEAVAGLRPGWQAVSPAELLRRFGLEEVKDRPGEELGTTRRRLLDVARAVATQPNVLLLDEPFAGLEAEQVSLIMAEVRRLQQTGASVVIIEHRLALLSGLAESVVVLVEGRVAARGALADVLHNSEVQAAYLGSRFRAGTESQHHPVAEP